MDTYTKQKIAEGFYSIEQDYVRCFLIEGDKEALLVDAGIGGDLRKYVEEITKLPITVVFTHADMDHIGSAGQFEKRFMHPSEFDYYKHNPSAVSMSPIWEGDILDFGKYRFEVVLIPGHTPGSIALLEREKRFLIGGDTIQTGGIYMFGGGRNLSACHASLHKLQSRIQEIDTIYASHDKLSLKSDIIHTLYEAAGSILDNKLQGEPIPGFDESIKRYSTNGVTFLYNKE